MPGITSQSFLSILPLLALVILAIVLLAFDLILKKHQHRYLLWMAAGGLAIIALGTLLFRPQIMQEETTWGGLLRMDMAGIAMITLICSGAAITAIFACDEAELVQHGEFPVLLVAATFGLSLMTVSTNLIILYLAMEMASIPLYVLAGFLVNDKRSTEAGLKYLLYGAMASALMLYGFSLLYGFSGSTVFSAIAAYLQGDGHIPMLPMIVAFALVLIGFGYKIAAVPFHFWTPDVYHGAPSPVSGFLATVSKTAGFVVLVRFLIVLFPALQEAAQGIISGMAVLSMLAGNLLAMQQKNIKRLLAYSSIAHAGYMLVGVAAGTASATTGVFYYLSGYLFTNLAAFALAAIAARQTGSDEIASMSGLSRRSPGLAFMMLIVFLSLAGIPPFAGFAGKIFVFLAAARAGMNWLVVVGVINSVIALFYYLNVLKVIYARPEEDGTHSQSFQYTGVLKTVLMVCLSAVLYLGVFFLPWYEILMQAGRLIWN